MEFPKPARPREKWAATARQALLFALPLAFAALLGVQWLDADFIMMRESAQKHSAEIADDLGGVLAQSVAGFSTQAWSEVQQAESDERSPSSALWQVIYGYNLNLLVLQRKGERTLFPPEDPLAMPKMWEEKLHALSDVADLLRDGDKLSGWFPNVSGEFYFECHRSGAGAEREENCIAVSSRQLFTLMFAALDGRAKHLSEWSFRLRDPFDRIVWRRGDSSESYQSFVLSGAMHNWTLELSGAPAPRRSLFGRLALAAPLALVWLLLVFQSRRAQNALLKESSARAALATRLSHDLRTPLANLKLYAELISRRSADVPEISRYCAVLTEEIDRLDLLAGETIFRGDALKREDAGQNAVDVCALARRILARYEKLLATSKSSCELTCDMDTVLRFNVTAFERILINLIDNARKYAPGRILVSIDFRDSLLSLAVRDFGSAASGAEGSVAPVSHGMGLAIVKELTRANGGSFSLSGADPGLRATATIKAEEESASKKIDPAGDKA
jgi:signal transduction histidine kinase